MNVDEVRREYSEYRSPLVMLAGVPDKKEANHEEYRAGCLAGNVNKLGLEIGGEALGRRALSTYLEYFSHVHIVGPEAENRAAIGQYEGLDERVTFHDMRGTISQTLEAAMGVVKESNERCVVVPNDILPRSSDLEAYLAATAPYKGALLVTTPVRGESVIPTNFPKRLYRVRTRSGAEWCAFPQIWTVSPDFPIERITKIANDFYHHRNRGAHRWKLLDTLWGAKRAYHGLEAEDRGLVRTIIALAAHLSLATRYPLIPPPSLRTAELRLGLIGLQKSSYPVVITEPLDAPSLAIDVDTEEELAILRRLYESGFWPEQSENE